MTRTQTRRRFLKTGAGVFGSAVGAIAAPAVVDGILETFDLDPETDVPKPKLN